MTTNAISVDFLYCSASMGATIHEAMREAAKLALNEGHRVVLKHNNVEYLVDPDAFVKTINVFVPGKPSQ